MNSPPPTLTLNAARTEAERLLAPMRTLLVEAESGADAWGACRHEWVKIEALVAALDNVSDALTVHLQGSPATTS